jgi:hypothetical protein
VKPVIEPAQKALRREQRAQRETSRYSQVSTMTELGVYNISPQAITLNTLDQIRRPTAIATASPPGSSGAQME